MNISKFAFDEDAVSIDKERWLTAYNMIQSKSKESIKVWLESQEIECREDMRRRLNVISKNGRNKK